MFFMNTSLALDCNTCLCFHPVLMRHVGLIATSAPILPCRRAGALLALALAHGKTKQKQKDATTKLEPFSQKQQDDTAQELLKHVLKYCASKKTIQRTSNTPHANKQRTDAEVRGTTDWPRPNATTSCMDTVQRVSVGMSTTCACKKSGSPGSTAGAGGSAGGGGGGCSSAGAPTPSGTP